MSEQGKGAQNAAGADMTGWAQPELLHETVKSHRIKWTLALLGLLFISTVDLIVFKNTLDLLFPSFTVLTWILAAGAALLALAAALYAGQQFRIAEANETRSLVAPILLLGWFVLGVALVYLRIRAGLFSPPRANYDGQSAPASGAGEKDAIVAVLLAVLYFLVGALAVYEGFALTNPAATAFRRVKQQLEEKTLEVTNSVGRVIRLSENKTVHEQDLEGIESQRQAARAARVALADELKEHARVQIALNLGDPEATGVTQLRPTPPRTDP